MAQRLYSLDQTAWSKLSSSAAVFIEGLLGSPTEKTRHWKIGSSQHLASRKGSPSIFPHNNKTKQSRVPTRRQDLYKGSGFSFLPLIMS
jgi:hypothetical protein